MQQNKQSACPVQIFRLILLLYVSHELTWVQHCTVTNTMNKPLASLVNVRLIKSVVGEKYSSLFYASICNENEIFHNVGSLHQYYET